MRGVHGEASGRIPLQSRRGHRHVDPEHAHPLQAGVLASQNGDGFFWQVEDVREEVDQWDVFGVVDQA
jgi:hypothetical protein